MWTIEDASGMVDQYLPSKFERLLLTFYGKAVQPRNGMLLIGDDYGTDLLLDPEDGTIYSVDPNGALPTRFVNSGIKQLAASLAAHREAEAIGSVQHLRSQIHAIDPQALADPDTWWSCVCGSA